MNLSSPTNEDEFQRYFLFRWEQLRKPWGQPIGSEQDEFESISHHVMAMEEDLIIGVGRIHALDSQTAQIRYMAVDPAYQCRGIGASILHQLESQASTWQCHRILLHARENALSFYAANGYTCLEKSHQLYNCIQHWLMTKVK